MAPHGDLFEFSFYDYYTCMLLVANSTPIVDFDSKLNSFLVNLDNKFDFPTPESPISTTGTKKKTELGQIRGLLTSCES